MSIEITALDVRYANITAVEGLTLSVPEGSMFGLLGPNGAGKSSTIRCIATTQSPSAGRILVGGHDTVREADAVRRLLGVVPQGIALYESLSVAENLRLFGGLYGLRGAALRDRVDWGLELSQLSASAGKRARELSGGMKRRLNIAAALLHDPKILVFDEPTTGVDPQSRNHIFDTVRRLHAEGRTVVYTTHYMEEVESLCERVAIMDHGKLVACDTLEALLSTQSTQNFHLRMSQKTEVEALRAQLLAAGIQPESITGEGRTLEQVFLELTGRALRDAS